MKPSLEFKLPRLFVFIMVLAIIFSALNVLILFYARNLFIYFQAIWSWAGVLLLSLIGAMLIGMFLAYRLLAFREFTPFEREMMEMRLEVDECRNLLVNIQGRIEAVEGDCPPSEPETGEAGDGPGKD